MTYPQYPLVKPITGDPRTAPVRETGIIGQMADKLNAYVDVKADFGAVGDGVADDTAEIQAAITAAFLAPGGTVFFPPGEYLVSSPLVTPNDTAGAIILRGGGQPRSFTGGATGDPVAVQGAQITYTGNTGSAFEAFLSSGNKRQYITIQDLTIEGNSGGASGHGLHFKATATTTGILATLINVTVNGAKQHGIFFDGNVFECRLFGVRGSQNGDRGFKAAANGSTIPGEGRFYGCSFNTNAVGVDLAGGGTWSYYGLTCTTNTAEGLIANGVGLRGVDLQLEVNGAAGGTQCSLTNLYGAGFMGININTVPSGTGSGMTFTGCQWNTVEGFKANSSVAGGGYMDIVLADTSTRCSIENYSSDDFVDRLDLGIGGAHLVRRGGEWLYRQTHAQQGLSSAADGSQTFNAILYDSFLSTRTGAGITVTIANPIFDQDIWHKGQRVTIHVYNNTAGATTTTWGGLWHLAGAWTDPAAGNTRSIVFEWIYGRGFYEVSRSAADAT